MAEKVSSTAWSEFKGSDFDDAQYKKAAILDRGSGEGKARYALPIREPDGTLNKNAVHAAASRISRVEGATDEQKKAAAKKLVSAYETLGETPPDDLKKLADQKAGGSDSTNGKPGGGKNSGKGMGKGKKPPPWMKDSADMADEDPSKVRFSEGDFVEVRYGIGRDRMQGKVKRIVTAGDVKGINEDFTITGTEESPAAEVEIHYQGEPSGKVVGFKTSMLRKSFMGDYSEDGEENGEQDLDNADEEGEVVQTPFDFGEATKLGRKLWRKQILPFRKIKSRGRTFSFDAKKADGIIASHEAGAFDQIPFVLGHTNNPEMGRGEVKGYIKTKTGLDALIETDSRGSEMVENNQSLGVSVRYLDNYTREADGKKFGPLVQHVAATYMPRMTGMSGWKPVNLGEELRGRLALDFSDEEAEVLDLTGSGWESDDEHFDDVKLDDGDRWMIAQMLSSEAGEEGFLDDSSPAGVPTGGEDAKPDSANSAKLRDSEGSQDNDEEEGDELSTEQKTAYEERISNLEYRLKAQGVEQYLDECKAAGVPKSDIDAARPVLLSAAADEEFEYVELSADGAESKKATTATQVKTILESRKGVVEFGERGADDAQGAKDMSDDEKIRACMAESKEKGVELSYDDAATELVTKGEIRLG